MKTNIKTTSRAKLMMAISMANAVNTKLHPRTKVAFYCETFIDLNDKLVKNHNKRVKEATKSLETELKQFKIDNANEKDGGIVYDEKGNFVFSKEKTKLVEAKVEELNEKIEEILEDVMAEEVEVKYITDPCALPDNFSVASEKALQGFAFCNPVLYKEEIESND